MSLLASEDADVGGCCFMDEEHDWMPGKRVRLAGRWRERRYAPARAVLERALEGRG